MHPMTMNKGAATVYFQLLQLKTRLLHKYSRMRVANTSLDDKPTDSEVCFGVLDIISTSSASRLIDRYKCWSL